MYIETPVRIIQESEIEHIQYFTVWKFWKMQYIESPPETIELYKNWSSKLRAKIKLYSHKFQYETDILSIID